MAGKQEKNPQKTPPPPPKNIEMRNKGRKGEEKESRKIDCGNEMLLAAFWTWLEDSK